MKFCVAIASVFAVACVHADDEFKPSLRSEGGDIVIDSVDVNIRLRGTDVTFSLSTLLQDIADLKAGHAAQLERANTLNSTLQSAIFDSSANTEGIVVLTGTNEGLVGKLATTATTSDNAAAEYQALRVDYDAQLKTDGEKYKAQVVAADTLKETVDKAAVLADANNKVIELNQEDRVVPVGTIRSSGAVVLKELDADDEITWFVNNAWRPMNVLNSNVKRQLEVKHPGRYLIHWTFGTINMGNGNGFAKVRAGYYLKSNPKTWKGCPSGERMVTELHGVADVGKVSMNANVNWECDIPSEATVTFQGWTNCGAKRCGIWNSATGFEEITYDRVAKVNTLRRSVRKDANTNIGKGNWKVFGKSWRWYPQDTGRYLVTWDARTYHGGNGFLKCQIRLNNKVVESSDRMVTEYQGMPFSFANHNAAFAWIVDYEGSTPATLSLWLQASGTKIGIQTDSNGWNNMQLVKLDPAFSGQRIQKGCKTCGGGVQVFGQGVYTTLLGYRWDLPRAGTYTIIQTLRTYATDAGSGTVKLDLDAAFTDAGTKMLLDDVGDVKYGESQRRMIHWDKKSWSLINHAATFYWQVTVTGPARVVLQGMRSKGGGKIGVQNDGNGFSGSIWYKNMDTLPPALTTPE